MGCLARPMSIAVMRGTRSPGIDESQMRGKDYIQVLCSVSEPLIWWIVQHERPGLLQPLCD